MNTYSYSRGMFFFFLWIKGTVCAIQLSDFNNNMDFLWHMDNSIRWRYDRSCLDVIDSMVKKKNSLEHTFSENSFFSNTIYMALFAIYLSSTLVITRCIWLRGRAFALLIKNFPWIAHICSPKMDSTHRKVLILFDWRWLKYFPVCIEFSFQIIDHRLTHVIISTLWLKD